MGSGGLLLPTHLDGWDLVFSFYPMTIHYKVWHHPHLRGDVDEKEDSDFPSAFDPILVQYLQWNTKILSIGGFAKSVYFVLAKFPMTIPITHNYFLPPIE